MDLGELNFDNILDENQIANLFEEGEETQKTHPEQ